MVTCRLTACTPGSAPGPTLGVECGKPLPLPFTYSSCHLSNDDCLEDNTTHTKTAFVRDYPGEPVPEETLTHPPSWWSSSLYQLLPSTTIYSILSVKITCLAIFLRISVHVLIYLLVWSPPPHIPYISSPNQCLLFATHAHTITTCFAVVPRLYHLFLVFLSIPCNSVFYLNIIHPSDHSHLWSLKCHLIFFPDRPGLTSV